MELELVHRTLPDLLVVAVVTAAIVGPMALASILGARYRDDGGGEC